MAEGGGLNCETGETQAASTPIASEVSELKNINVLINVCTMLLLVNFC